MTKYATTLLNFLDTKGLRKSDLVNTLNIPDSTVRAWFSRDTMPAADVCYKVAKYLGVTVEYLLTGEEEGKNAPKKNTLTQKIEQLTEAQKEEIEDLVDVKIAKNEEKEEIAKAI